MKNNISIDEFAVVDVEAANPDRSSICQIGVIHCNKDGLILKEEKTFIDPKDWFDPFLVEEIHKINEEMVRGAPTFAQWSERLNGYLDGRVVLQHSNYDKKAISRACDKHGVSTPKSIFWLNNVLVARRAWPDMAKRKGGKGYKLSVICSELGYEYAPHDALEDARAALHVFNEACKATGLGISEWPERVDQPIDLEKSKRSYRSKDPEKGKEEYAKEKALFATEPDSQGPYLGEVLTFTGTIRPDEGEMPRREAILIAHKLGFKVNKEVKEDNTVLVFGYQDMRQLAKGDKKSKKRQKAEELIRDGQTIEFYSDADFLEMAKDAMKTDG